MASIQIPPDKVFKACEKCKKHWDEKERVYTHSVDTQYIEALKAIEKIQKLAEYELNSNEKPPMLMVAGCPVTFPYKTITITHNDFELIGEFL